MRIGVNPEKLKPKRLNHKPHRVIMPVYIPNLEEDYFKNSLEVLKISLSSLWATINPEQTNITVINNASCREVDEYLESLFQEGKIDKYVKRRENRGKVEPVLSEAMGSYENYITITDADVFFRRGWLDNTLQIFNTFSRAGVVSPLPAPHLYSYCNKTCITDSFLTGKLKNGSCTDIRCLKEFEKSIGVDLMKKYYTSQYNIQKNNVIALLGSGHFITTYKNIFHSYKKKVPLVFANGLEEEFIDSIFENSGYWRLSTTKAYVYHMGNTIHNEKHVDYIPDLSFENTGEELFSNKHSYNYKKYLGKLILKYMKYKSNRNVVLR